MCVVVIGTAGFTWGEEHAFRSTPAMPWAKVWAMDDLQFDRVEHDDEDSEFAPGGGDAPAAPGPHTGDPCGICQASLGSAYFLANGLEICAACAGPLKGTGGGKGAAFLRAFGFGAAAATLGALLWYGIIAAFNWELGIIAIGVGFAVGHAVRVGSGNRGGRIYQVLAVWLTWTAITMTYVPDTVTMIQTPETEMVGEPMYGAEPVPPAAMSTAPPEDTVSTSVALMIALPWRRNRKLDVYVEGPFVPASV